jgi:hypothetical protein
MINRIRRITEELQAMHAEISSQTSPDSIGPRQSVFDEADAMELLTDFKLAIDQLRSALWLYIKDFSDRPDDPALKATHLLRATEMLHALTQYQQSPPPVSSFQEGSFFDRLHTVMDAYALAYHCLDQTNGENLTK